ncbi:sensor histidine kinase [Enterococcus avium]
MINQFRKRLITMTTIFVAIILIAGFLTIFITTYLKQQSDNFEKLNQSEELTISGGKVSFDEKSDDAVQINRIATGAGVYFNLLVDKTGKPIMVDSALKLSKKQYKKAAKYAWKNREGGTVKINGREWQYVVAPAIANLDYDNKDKNVDKDDETYLMRFLDITDSKKNLFTLAITLLIVGIGLMIFFFLVIIYFTNRAIKPMEDAWKKQKQFIADASHELKTPLSIISTNVGVLYSSKEDTINDQINWLDNISRGTERMNGLVSKMLTIAKTDNVFEQMNFSTVQVDQLIRDSLSNYETKFESKNIEVNCDLSEVSAKTDEGLLQQLFDIFMDNAYKYTNENGSFDITLKAKGRDTTIQFKNTGEGIAEEDLPKVFNRFYRTNEVRQKYEGSYGLGLSIALSIVEQLGGKIDVKSSIKQETEFTIQLSLKKNNYKDL